MKSIHRQSFQIEYKIAELRELVINNIIKNIKSKIREKYIENLDKFVGTMWHTIKDKFSKYDNYNSICTELKNKIAPYTFIINEDDKKLNKIIVHEILSDVKNLNSDKDSNIINNYINNLLDPLVEKRNINISKGNILLKNLENKKGKDIIRFSLWISVILYLTGVLYPITFLPIVGFFEFSFNKIDIICHILSPKNILIYTISFIFLGFLSYLLWKSNELFKYEEGTKKNIQDKTELEYYSSSILINTVYFGD